MILNANGANNYRVITFMTIISTKCYFKNECTKGTTVGRNFKPLGISQQNKFQLANNAN